MLDNNTYYVYQTLLKSIDILLLRQNIQLSMHYVILGIACGGVEKVLVRERHYNYWGLSLCLLPRTKLARVICRCGRSQSPSQRGGGAELRQ